MTLLICTMQLSLADSFYVDHAKGWHWYDDPVQKIEDKKSDSKSPGAAEESVSQIKASVKRAMDQAILEPNVENVSNYIRLQHQVSQRAHQFADSWQRALLLHPELDYTLKHPTNNAALQIYYDEEHKAQEGAVKLISKSVGLFFFYKSTCHYCQKFAPILKRFAFQNNIPIVPVTLDGENLAEFPDSRVNAGQAERFGVKATPALFVVDPYQQKAYPVSYGFMSENELRERILKVVQQFQGVRDAS